MVERAGVFRSGAAFCESFALPTLCMIAGDLRDKYAPRALQVVAPHFALLIAV
jgi:hypothetical protein